MRFHALACDYDGTMAHHGRVDAATIAALERIRDSGRRLLLVSGRQLEDLQSVFGRLDLFHRAVLENGALVVDPATGAARALGEAPPQAFVAALERRGVHPLGVGRVIVATWEPHERVVLEVIHELGLELQVIFNKGAVMVLPSGINKAVGLRAALREVELSPHNVVGIGDAENDHALLAACERGVAVANALPKLKERADWVTEGARGDGVRELAAALLGDDLRELAARHRRPGVLVGHDPGGEPVALDPWASPVLIAGTSGAGKSTLGTSLLEQLGDRGYQFFIADPEGDYVHWGGVAHAGDGTRRPTVAEVLEPLALPGQSAVANLLGVPLRDRPAFFAELLGRLLELRGRTGRPHWIALDEAHHLLPRENAGAAAGEAAALVADERGLLLLTVHPEHLAPAVLRAVGTVIALGESPRDTLAAFARAAGREPPALDPSPLPSGSALLWRCDPASAPAPRIVQPRPPRLQRLRHVRKYAAGELGPDVSFWFRGPTGGPELRAHNLQAFLDLAEQVPDETWNLHLRAGDVSRWFRESIKDAVLTAEAEAVEGDPHLPAARSRARIRAAVERRYTAPS